MGPLRKLVEARHTDLAPRQRGHMRSQRCMRRPSRAAARRVSIAARCSTSSAAPALAAAAVRGRFGSFEEVSGKPFGRPIPWSASIAPG